MAGEIATPVAKHRQALLAKMEEPTRQIALKYDERLRAVSNDFIMVQYNLGAQVKGMLADEASYGSEAVKQLAEYLDVKGGATTLYSLRNFATQFDKEFVKENSKRQMAKGGFLSIHHWFQLMKLKSQGDAKKLLERTFKESLSANDLEAEIRSGSGGSAKNARAGGRKPKAPSNPIIGLQQTFVIAQKLARFSDVFGTGVADAIDEIDASKVNDVMLEKLEKTRTTVDSAVHKGEEMRDRLDKNIKRVKKILGSKATEAAEEYEEGGDEEEEAAEAPKKAKKKLKKKGVPAKA